MTANFNIGGENNYIVGTISGLSNPSDNITISNTSSTGDINVKLGSDTSTSKFAIDNTVYDMFSVSGDKTTKFRSSNITSNNTSYDVGEKSKIQLVGKSDDDLSSSVVQLNFNADIPTLSLDTVLVKSNNVEDIDRSVNGTYIVDTLLKGIINRTTNGEVTDFLPDAATLVGGVNQRVVGNTFYFMVHNKVERTLANIRKSIFIDVQSGGTFISESQDVKYLTPGQSSLFKVVLTNVSSSFESYSLYRMGTQGERSSDYALRSFTNHSTPKSLAITGGVTYILPDIITNADFTKFYATDTFFEVSGSSAGIINKGPPCNVRIHAIIYLKTDSASDVFIKHDITYDQLPINVNGSQGAMYKTGTVSGGVTLDVMKLNLPTDGSISLTITSDTTCNVEIITCQLSVYQVK
uniref:Uncharacterized protein n=1 Tax=viral metagenome TaxID=1070528 RepID=A0A6C0LLQ7_9ZZZZ